MNKHIKRITAMVILLALIFCTGGCGKVKREPIHITLTNRTEGELTCFGAIISIEGVEVNDTNMSISPDSEEGTYLSGGVVDIVLNPDDIPENARLLTSAMTVYVSTGDEIHDVSIVALPMEYGETYNFNLDKRDDTYTAWLNMVD